MSFPNKIVQIGHDNFDFFTLSICAKLHHQKCFCQIPLLGYVNLFAIVERALTTSSRELLPEHGIEDNSDFSDLVDEESDRNRGMRKTVDEIHGAIDGVDDPCWCIAELHFLALAGLLLAYELVIRKLRSDAVHEQLLDLLVSLGHKIRRMTLDLYGFPLGIS